MCSCATLQGLAARPRSSKRIPEALANGPSAKFTARSAAQDDYAAPQGAERPTPAHATDNGNILQLGRHLDSETETRAAYAARAAKVTTALNVQPREVAQTVDSTCMLTLTVSSCDTCVPQPQRPSPTRPHDNLRVRAGRLEGVTEASEHYKAHDVSCSVIQFAALCCTTH